MKKDSFTFSDKLKKSKTLPLSKRIPSRVGGEVKAKRTLFERAQRDLPFIIVAALALLLLPFLSRESGDIDTPSVVWGDGDTYMEDFNLPKSQSTEGEIALSSFRNPLDLIIRHGDKDSSSRDAVDSEYSAGEEGSSSAAEGYGSSSTTRSTYGSEEYSSSPATSRYGKTVKRSIRNSVNRVPTSIGSLSRGSMVSANGGNAPTHTLAFGGRSKDAAPKVQGPGVRPVALQPLTAAGKGRDLTGSDALYAEAARSIGAMNRPGAKQALLDAQLADVDGKPLGETKGAEAKGDPNRPGAGGGPSNNWSHTNQKPWWWDMMKDRSQRRWELWHYNWEKLASDSLIALTRGLASCLITGSNDFKVDRFLGADGGDADGKCVDVNGNEVYIRRRQYINELKVSGGKDGSGSAVSALPWEEACVKYGHGTVVMKPSGSRKSMLEVRLNCLGVGLGDIKDRFETRRAAMCDGLTGDPMSINITVQRNNKDKTGRIKTTGFYVLNQQGCVVNIQKAKYGVNEITKPDGSEYSPEERLGLKEVVVYRVGSYGTRHYPEGNEAPVQKNRDLTDYQNKNGQYFDDDDIYWESGDYDNSFNVASKKAQTLPCYTEAQLQEDLKPVGKWRTSGRRLNQLQRCGFSKYFASTFYNPVEIAQEAGYMEEKKPTVDCQDKTVMIEKVPDNYRFTTTITNPGKYTTAFVLEYVEESSYDQEFVSDAKQVSNRTGYRLKRRIDYYEGSGYENKMHKNDDGSWTFEGDVIVGDSSKSVKGSDDQEEPEFARPGRGWIIWTTSNTLGGEKEEQKILKGNSVSDVYPNLNGKYAICKYRWGCGKGDGLCPDSNNDSDKYCFVLDDNNVRHYYEAVRVKSAEDYVFRGLREIDKNEINRLDLVNKCDDICQYLKGGKRIGYGISGRPDNNEENIIPEEDLKGKITIPEPCPVCNPKQESYDGNCLLEGKVYPSIKVIGNDGTEYYFRTSNDPIIGTATVPCTPICAKKAAALGLTGILITDSKDSVIPVDDNEITTGDKISPIKPGGEVCPFCNGKCYMSNGEVFPSTSFKGNDDNTYYVRTSVTPIGGTASFPCTPICAKKAAALGIEIFKTSESTPTVPEGSSLTENEQDISPVKAGDEKLCPYCNPEEKQKPVGPLASRAINFQNGCYDQYYIDKNYDFQEFKEAVIDVAVAQGVTNFIIEGHASGRVANCPEGNCNELLAYDRAVYLYNSMAPYIEGKYNVNLIDETNKSKFGSGAYPKPGTNGLPNYKICKDHWPLKRNTLTTISSNGSLPQITIYLRGLGISESITGKQDPKETPEEARTNINIGEDDRSAIIYPQQ